MGADGRPTVSVSAQAEGPDGRPFDADCAAQDVEDRLSGCPVSDAHRQVAVCLWVIASAPLLGGLPESRARIPKPSPFQTTCGDPNFRQLYPADLLAVPIAGAAQALSYIER